MNQISIRRATYDKLVAGLKRTARGDVRPNALKERVERLINEALDRETARKEG